MKKHIIMLCGKCHCEFDKNWEYCQKCFNPSYDCIKKSEWEKRDTMTLVMRIIRHREYREAA